jgi:hypothetical protein
VPKRSSVASHVTESNFVTACACNRDNVLLGFEDGLDDLNLPKTRRDTESLDCTVSYFGERWGMRLRLDISRGITRRVWDALLGVRLSSASLAVFVYKCFLPGPTERLKKLRFVGKRSDQII